MEDALVLMFTKLGWCAGASGMMHQKLYWRRFAAGGLLIACGVTEGRTKVVVVKPEAMMMDGFVKISCFENCYVVLVGWMHWSRAWKSSILVVVLIGDIG